MAVIGLWVFVFVLAAFFSYFSYLPIPLLTTIQGKPENIIGKVTDKKWECGGRVIKVSLSIPMHTTDKKLVAMSFEGSFTYYLYFEDSQKIPDMGQIIKAESYNRLYRAQGISINWVTSWTPYAGEIPTSAMGTAHLIKQTSSECFLED